MLHDQYVMERYKEGLTGKGTQTASPKFDFKTPVFKTSKVVDLTPVSELNKEHPARDYLERRKIEDLASFKVELRICSLSSFTSQSVTVSFHDILIMKEFVLILQEICKGSTHTTVVAFVYEVILHLEEVTSRLI